MTGLGVHYLGLTPELSKLISLLTCFVVLYFMRAWLVFRPHRLIAWRAATCCPPFSTSKRISQDLTPSGACVRKRSDRNGSARSRGARKSRSWNHSTRDDEVHMAA